MIFHPFNDFDWLCLFLLFRFKKHISVYYILMALADILMPLSVNVYTRNSTVLIKLSALLRNLFGSHFDPELCGEFIKCRPQIEKLYSISIQTFRNIGCVLM